MISNRMEGKLLCIMLLLYGSASGSPFMLLLLWLRVKSDMKA